MPAVGHGGRSKLSRSRTDILIRDLIRTGRAATNEEIDQITRRIAEAPFPSAGAHLAKRVDDGQWADGTMEEEYLADLRRAARDDATRLAIFKRRGGNLAAILTEMERIVEAYRRGVDWEPLLLVVYSADRGIIVTGYQASSLRAISVPEDVRWLR